MIEKHTATGDVLEAVGGLVAAMKDAMKEARRTDANANAGDANG